ncbi:hypothetical protein C2E23DRAFT_493115 [Lenzites betulinus]|nr:hypothetical protein C2E23DRAFT_493115 [Lenzites betulinus]
MSRIVNGKESELAMASSTPLQIGTGECVEVERVAHPRAPSPQANVKSVPVEILEMILIQVWLRLPASEPRTRWAFFRTACLVDHCWGDVMHRVAQRHVMVCLHSTSDLKGYRAIGQRLLQMHSRDPAIAAGVRQDAANRGPHPTPLQPGHTRESTGPNQLAIPPHLLAPIFHRSSLHLLASSVDILASTPDERGGETTAMEYLDSLRCVVPDCARLSIVMLDGFNLDTPESCKRNPTAATFKFAGQLPSLTHLDLASPFQTAHAHQPAGVCLPISAELSNVRHLRLATYPACACAKPQVTGMPHGSGWCPAEALMASFSGVKHLHIGSPYRLKNILPPPALHTLTLDITQVNANRQHSMLGYKLVEALTDGLLRGPTPYGAPKKVVVNSPEEPLGWGPAKVACEESGVVLCRAS